MSQYIDSVATGTYAVNASSSAPPATGMLSTATDWVNSLSGFFGAIGGAIITERQVEAAINQADAYGPTPTPSAMQTVQAKTVSFLRSPLGAVVVAGVAVAVWRKLRKA